MSTTLFHGSNVIVEHPNIRIRGYEKDIGYGFYRTFLENQAKKWSMSKKGIIWSMYMCLTDMTIMQPAFLKA